MYSHNTKTTNEPTASNNKSDRPQVKIWDTWKTLTYLNIDDSFHLKDLEISQYKRESKWRSPIQICRFSFLLIVVLFGFLNIKSVKIYAIPYSSSTTLLLYKLDTLLLKQKNLPVLDITGFFFRTSTQVKAEVRTRNPLYPIRAASFVSIVLYLILVLQGKRGCSDNYDWI